MDFGFSSGVGSVISGTVSCRVTRFLPGFSSSTIVPVYSDFHRVRPLELRGPKALGDIRGVTYIYGMFYRFGLIDVP